MAEYTIPLRKGYHQAPRYKRTKKAVDVLRAYLKRHTKADSIKLGQHLNEHLWEKGIRNPPAKVTVVSEVIDIDGVKTARVELLGKNFKESVRPEERAEEESGLKGKLQAMTQKPKEEQKVQEKAETSAPKKTPAKTAEKPTPEEGDKKAPEGQKVAGEKGH